jgi:hypothetical protein
VLIVFDRDVEELEAKKEEIQRERHLTPQLVGWNAPPSL